ncbi:Autoinducer binding domain-containing protein [Thiothrix eikelboomii]|uniref:Autoinducer binding domain-containing protein n=1 Tax=Thiothrix eikelboomii TaxID=92487 RepID=A0A1T4XSF7_9GAMM|nr:autoinducer binding domain-containing protein [Thiothrix eikelboomii]SKA91995.1 Autoinducer binding domain-containing protein [Thiothrix eikelboomii]
MTYFPPTPEQPHPFGREFTDLTAAISHLGFDGVLYTFYPKPMYLCSKVQPVLHYSESFAPFVAHYIKSNYGNRDFVLRLAVQNRKKKPIDWWNEIAAGTVSHEERAVTEDARKNFGIQYGLSIPVLKGAYAISGISVISLNPCPIHFQKLKKAHIHQLFELARQYHARIVNSKEELRFFLQPLLDRLNGTQEKIIKHMLTGLPMKSIPHTSGVTPRYAEKVWSNLREEFGSITTNEFIYLLGMLGMFDDLDDLDDRSDL